MKVFNSHQADRKW